MAVSERTLKQWRLDALGMRSPRDMFRPVLGSPDTMYLSKLDAMYLERLALNFGQRILRLTQELSDVNLLARKR